MRSPPQSRRGYTNQFAIFSALQYRICLIKLTLLSYLGLHEEALQLATQLITMYTEPAGPVASDLNSMSAIKLEEYPKNCAGKRRGGSLSLPFRPPLPLCIFFH